jgi:hypothetical protein
MGWNLARDKVEVTPAFDFEVHKVILLDTPRFDDTDRSEKDIFKEITEWLTNMCAKGHDMDQLRS